jgi:ribosome-associated translation inhibitor RaiA
MAITRQVPRLKVTFDIHQYPLSESEERFLREKLASLERQVEQMPVADLRVQIVGNARSNDVTVKLTLLLPGTTLVVDDHDAIPTAACERALTSLLQNLHEYKDRLGRVPQRQKMQDRTLQELHPSTVVDDAAVAAAVEAADYAAFRRATLPYDDDLRMRVGRWVQRYPEVDAEIGSRWEIADVMEEVFLMAFEDYSNRPGGIPFGVWLDDLIDPAIKALQRHRDEELENIAMARTERDASEGRVSP